MSSSESINNIIKKSILFYQSRNYSEEEMIHDIVETLRVSPDEVKAILKNIKRN